MLKALNEFLRKYWLEVVLLALLLSVYSYWIFGTGIISSGDWSYHYREFLLDFKRLPSIWEDFTGLGRVDIFASFDLLKFFYGLLSKFIDFSLSERIIYFYPIVIFSYIGILKLSKYIYGKDNLARLYFALFYLFNTYILSIQTGYITYANVYALAPLIVYSFLRLFDLESFSLKYTISTALLLILAYQYESRGVVVLSYFIGMLFLYKLISSEKKLINFIHIMVVYIVLGLASIFSIIPLLFIDKGSIESTGGLFTAFNTLSDSITFHSYAWNPNPLTHFTNIPFSPTGVLPYQYAITIILFLPIVLYKKYTDKSIISFLLITSLICIFLLKQQNPPFGELYDFAFKNIPTFNLFRESNKFAVFILPAALLFGFSVSTTSKTLKKPTLKYTFLILASGLLLINTVPILNRQIGTLFVKNTVPTSYITLKNQLVGEQQFYRTFWFPTVSRWAFSSSKHPAINSNDYVGQHLVNLTTSLPVQRETYYQQKVFNIPYIKDLLDISAVKYVVVPERDKNEYGDSYTDNDRSDYLRVLEQQSWLTKISGNDRALTVYENKNTPKEIDAFDHLYKIDTSQLDLDNYYKLASYRFNNKFFFTDMNSPVPGTEIQDLFSYLKITNTPDSEITSGINGQTKSTIFENSLTSPLYYSVANGILTIRTLNNKSVATESKIENSQDLVVISSIQLQPNQKYYIASDGKLYGIDINSSSQQVISKPVMPKLYIETSESIIPAANLNNGAWAKKVEDCNNYDNRPQIRMSLIEDKDHPQEKAIELRTTKHTACTGKDSIDVEGGSDYAISFDYRVINGRSAGYTIHFNDSQKTVMGEDMAVTDKSWKNYHHVITVPKDATKMSIKLNAYVNDSRPTLGVSRYSSLQLKKLKTAENIPSTVDTFRDIGDKNDYKPISITVANWKPVNLIDNADFKDGPWQAKVSDCNAYDNKPAISQRIIEGPAGNNTLALELAASRHTACTGPAKINTQDGDQYYIQFGYQSPNSNNAQILISYDDSQHTVVSKNIHISDTKWHTYGEIFTVPFGAKNMTVTFFAKPNELSSKLIINRYADVSIIKVPNIKDRFYALTKNTIQISKPDKIETVSSSPTFKNVKIKGAHTPFYLLLSAAYSINWQAKLSDSSQIIPPQNHIKLSNTANGWYIDPATLCKNNPPGCTKNADGSYDMALTIEFTPQRWFNVGMVISGSTLLACIGYLGYDFVLTRKRRHVTPVGYAPAQSAMERSYVKTQKHPLLHRRKNRVYKLRK